MVSTIEVSVVTLSNELVYKWHHLFLPWLTRGRGGSHSPHTTDVELAIGLTVASVVWDKVTICRF